MRGMLLVLATGRVKQRQDEKELGIDWFVRRMLLGLATATDEMMGAVKAEVVISRIGFEMVVVQAGEEQLTPRLDNLWSMILLGI